MDSSKIRQTLTTDEVAALREKTEVVSKILKNQLQGYLDTLKPLLAPRRILGRHVGSREDVTGSDHALSRLKELYREGSQTPFGLPIEFPDTALAQLDNQPAVYPWEYPYTAKSERDSKNLTITSPAQWILTYDSGVTLAQVRSMLENKTERKTEVLRQFVINALVMHLFIRGHANLIQLFAALRYHVEMKSLPGLGPVSFVTIHAPLTSFRPADDILLMATRFSGVPAFVEMVSLDAIENLQDPLRVQLQQALV